MTLAVLQASVLQTNGALSVAAGAQITVRTPAGALVTLYEDRAGTTPTGANPVFADSKGFFRVYVAPGRYDVTVTTSSGTQVYEDISLFADGSVIGTAAAADILGTVSATGTYPNLVPTGAIMEAGSNANGEYVKYADGTMICRFGQVISLTTGSWTALGSTNLVHSSLTTWTFPAAFISQPSCGLSINSFVFYRNLGVLSTTQWRASLIREGVLAIDETVRYFAVGRWK